MNLQQALDKLPDSAKGAVVIQSGGMDSTTAARLAVEKYGKENVCSLTFDYGQKQSIEIDYAHSSCTRMGIKHKILDARFLGEIAQGFSANVDKSIAMPTIQEVLGDPRPKTYVPNRNMILMSIAAAYAEVQGLDTIICGFQVNDEYSYHDTTQRFVDALNGCLEQNRILKIKIIAPFSELTKAQEIELLKEMGDVELLAHTWTCYNPQASTIYDSDPPIIHYVACGKCPACAGRIANFAKAGLIDPCEYAIEVPWDKLCAQS